MIESYGEGVRRQASHREGGVAARLETVRRGTVQTGFLLEDTNQIFIPQLSKKFTKAIVSKVAAARVALESAKDFQQKTESPVLAALNHGSIM